MPDNFVSTPTTMGNYELYGSPDLRNDPQGQLVSGMVNGILTPIDEGVLTMADGE